MGLPKMSYLILPFVKVLVFVLFENREVVRKETNLRPDSRKKHQETQTNTFRSTA